MKTQKSAAKTAPTHTPGPWRISHDPMNPNPRIIGADNEIVTVVSQGKFFAKPTEENARLIAAAPDLLAALKLMIQVADDTCREGLGYGIDDEAGEDMVLVRAAIAKAEGWEVSK